MDVCRNGSNSSERPYKELAEKGGDFELIQFWLNVPAKNKMEQPVYTAISEEKTPHYKSDNGKVTVSVVSGNFKNLKGFIDHFVPVTVLRFDFEKDGEIDFEIPSNQNTLMYLLDGGLVINDSEKVEEKNLIWFGNDDSKIKVKAAKPTRAILLAGEPIGEEVDSYGPFVMNNHTQIMEAIRDSQMGKMGILIEE